MRPTPSRRITATGALIAVTALLAVGVQAGSAAAAPDSAPSAPVAGKADPGALPKSSRPPSAPS